MTPAQAIRAYLDQMRPPVGGLTAETWDAPHEAAARNLEWLEEALEELKVAHEVLVAATAELNALVERDAEEGEEDDMELAPVAYLVTDRSGIIRKGNQAAERLLGVGRSWLTGRPLSGFVPATERRAFRERLLSLAENGEAEWEQALQPRGSVAIWVLVGARGDAGSERLRWVLRDVTDARQRQAERAENEELHRSLVEALPVAAFALDVDGTVTFWNEAANRLLGWSEAEVAGRLCPLLEQAGELRELQRRVREEGAGAEATLPVRGADGECHWLEVRLAPFAGRAGSSPGTVWTLAAAAGARPGSAGRAPEPRSAEWIVAGMEGSQDGATQPADLLVRLRTLLATGAHLGYLRPGDPLPSIRLLAQLSGLDHRAVAGALRQLAGEGRVEIRNRRGLFVADAPDALPDPGGETGEWLTAVLADARALQIRTPMLPELLRRMTSSRPLRCACLESTDDDLYMLCSELRRHWGFETYPVRLETGGPAGVDRRVLRELDGRLRGADVLVTTAYHSAPARDLAAQLGIPLVVVTLAPEVVSALEERLAQTTLTAIVADEACGERLRSIRGGAGDRLRVVRADDRAALASLDPAEPVFLTAAARERLGTPGFRLLVPVDPFLSPESARQLAAVLIRHNRGSTS